MVLLTIAARGTYEEGNARVSLVSTWQLDNF